MALASFRAAAFFTVAVSLEPAGSGAASTMALRVSTLAWRRRRRTVRPASATEGASPSAVASLAVLPLLGAARRGMPLVMTSS